MATRIHRALGWKTTHPDPKRIDAILESDVPGTLVALIERAIAKAQAEGRGSDAQWLSYERMFATPPRSPREVGVSDVLVNADGPYGARTTWIIIPPAFASQWHRRDDHMDYHATRWSPGWEAPPTVELEAAPYPYENQSSEHPSRVPIVVRTIADEFGFDASALRPVLETWWA